jgi:GDPmannose 4,6-dehydratase
LDKTAIVTGPSGMDGAIASRQLIEKGYKVYGLFRRRSDSPNLGCAADLENNPAFEVVEGDITDLSSLLRLTLLAKADRFFSFAAQSHVGTSFVEPVHTAQATGLSVLNCLEAIRLSGIHTRFYNSATSELFGGITNEPCNEDSLIYPRSPYACAKAFGFYITRTYRQAYKMFASSGILYNHEHETRGPNFVTRKITQGAANIKVGNQDKLYLGNLDARRDWGYAEDYVHGATMILDHREPDDFVLGTGESHSVREFCEVAFEYAGLGDYRQYVEIDLRFYRPCEVDVLLADYSKAKRVLGWEPKVTFRELVQKMVDHDLSLLE